MMASDEETAAFIRDFDSILAAQPGLDGGGEIALFPAQHKVGVMRENQGDIDLDVLEAHEPGRGWGAAVMRLVCDLADRHGVAVYVRAHAPSEDDMDAEDMQAALERFYRTFGFADKGSHRERDMLRTPQPPSPESTDRLARAHDGFPAWGTSGSPKP